jgi:hypothetical protein
MEIRARVELVGSKNEERTNKQRHNRAQAKQRKKGTKRPFFSFKKNLIIYSTVRRIKNNFFYSAQETFITK